MNYHHLLTLQLCDKLYFCWQMFSYFPWLYNRSNSSWDIHMHIHTHTHTNRYMCIHTCIHTCMHMWLTSYLRSSVDVMTLILGWYLVAVGTDKLDWSNTRFCSSTHKSSSSFHIWLPQKWARCRYNDALNNNVTLEYYFFSIVSFFRNIFVL